MTQTRFMVDIFSLLGADVFKGVWTYMSLFGMFKLLRVFRITQLIQ